MAMITQDDPSHHVFFDFAEYRQVLFESDTARFFFFRHEPWVRQKTDTSFFLRRKD